MKYKRELLIGDLARAIAEKEGFFVGVIGTSPVKRQLLRWRGLKDGLIRSYIIVAI